MIKKLTFIGLIGLLSIILLATACQSGGAQADADDWQTPTAKTTNPVASTPPASSSPKTNSPSPTPQVAVQNSETLVYTFEEFYQEWLRDYSIQEKEAKFLIGKRIRITEAEIQRQDYSNDIKARYYIIGPFGKVDEVRTGLPWIYAKFTENEELFKKTADLKKGQRLAIEGNYVRPLYANDIADVYRESGGFSRQMGAEIYITKIWRGE